MKVNKIICGDNIQVMKTLPDNCINLTVTSPPYDNLRDYQGYTFDFEAVAQQLYRITKQGSVVVWVVGDATVNGSETGTSFRQALYFMEVGFNLHDTMIYAKKIGRPIGSVYGYNQTFEYMFILSKGKIKTFNPIQDVKNKNFKNKQKEVEHCRQGGNKRVIKPNKYNKRSNVWLYVVGGGLSAKGKIPFKHPAIFPERLAQDHIISWSNKGDLIFDPFCGSGTTCKMARENDRDFIGIEISEEYCKIANQRINNAQLSLF